MKKELIDLQEAYLVYYPDFFTVKQSDRYYENLLYCLNWQQEKIKMFGKEVLQPRLTSFYGEPGKNYTYSGLRMKPQEFTGDLTEIKDKCEAYAKTKFNVCLANLYRDGSDSMGWHSDDEKELGNQPVIASVSFGAERIFHLRHKADHKARYKIELQHGSLLIMKGKTQEYWKHQLPKTSKKISPRINLTFRNIY